MFENVIVYERNRSVRGECQAQLGFGYTYWFIGGELIMFEYDLFQGGAA